MILVNGESAEQLSANDRGLAYGDGVFETIALIGGRPRHWERHMQRLRMGCERLAIQPPAEKSLVQDIERLSRVVQPAVVKIIVTRGAGGRGYSPVTADTPTRIASAHTWPDIPPGWSEHGVEVRVCRTRLGRNPALAGLKHLNRLEQVLASSEPGHDRCADGLMLDAEGWVIEGTRTNLFTVSAAGRVTTPALTHCGVAGVMRAVVIDALSGLGIATATEDLTLDAVATADEVFLCNSIVGLWPVRRLLIEPSRDYRSGPFTARLRRHLRERGDIT